MRRVRNVALEARMRDYGFTAAALAAAVNDHIAAATGEPGRYTDRDVRRLLCGTTRWPHRATRNALEVVLGVSALELGFVPRARSALPPTPGQPSQVGGAAVRPARPGHPKGNTMKRRDVLRIVGGISSMVITIDLPDLPTRGRLGMSDVERLRGPVTELFRIDDQLGGVALADAALRLANRVLAAVNDYETSPQVAAAMYGLAGEYLATAGWFCVDAGVLSAAGNHLDQALRLATLSGDPDLHAQIWNYQAMRARQARAYGEAQHIACAGLATTAARRNPKIAALFHARLSHGHAWAGNTALAIRSIGRAWDCFGKATSNTPTPAWLAFVDQAQLYALTAITHNAVGQYAAAATAATKGLQLLPDTYVRNRVHGHLHLTDSLLGAREPEAAHAATAALNAASQLNGALHTGRVAARLRHIRQRLAAWHGIPEAREWVDRYAAATANATRGTPPTAVTT